MEKSKIYKTFRTDEYGRGFVYETEQETAVIEYRTGSFTEFGIDFSVSESFQKDILKIRIEISSKTDINLKRLGFRLGIDTYMDKYPDWNDKFFPTALRCEKNGFWSCFMTPNGEMLSVCSPSKIVSWKNEYNRLADGDVGHRIYTSTVDFINTAKQPERHPSSPVSIGVEPLTFELYYFCPENEEQLFAFVEKYAKISVPKVNKFTLEAGEELLINGKIYDKPLKGGLNKIYKNGFAEITVYVRKDWFYYLDCARKSAEICQQKPGTHAESWYGFFSRVEYAKIIKNDEYTATLCADFKKVFNAMTERVDGILKMRKETDINRLQNTSSMLSLLADFYELTGDTLYLDYANDLAKLLIGFQAKDGSYRNGTVHYTCVIYPAKSMLELYLAEKAAGYDDRAETHYASALKAIDNLLKLLDNIETEGQMTFEDGMISCESLQLAFLATLLDDGEYKQKLIKAAEIIIQKHRCLEQQILPDCRTRGCTARFWEARYDLNFFENMLNMPHGWTSWKNYATYYLYLLTGKIEYLKDTMDTLGACMQCVDEDGVLHWGYVADPCITGLRLAKGSSRENPLFEQVTVGEEYLPMISDWYRQEDGRIPGIQYLRSIKTRESIDRDYGGSCDNDVHEHFKGLTETVFGKAFIHIAQNRTVYYNCFYGSNGYETADKFVNEWVVYSDKAGEIKINGQSLPLKPGFNKISQN